MSCFDRRRYSGDLSLRSLRVPTHRTSPPQGHNYRSSNSSDGSGTRRKALRSATCSKACWFFPRGMADRPAKRTVAEIDVACLAGNASFKKFEYQWAEGGHRTYHYQMRTHLFLFHPFCRSWRKCSLCLCVTAIGIGTTGKVRLLTYLPLLPFE